MWLTAGRGEKETIEAFNINLITAIAVYKKDSHSLKIY